MIREDESREVRLVAEGCSGSPEEDAVRELVESFGNPPGLRRNEERSDDVNERLIRLAELLSQE
jgi:hypothetical protein